MARNATAQLVMTKRRGGLLLLLAVTASLCAIWLYPQRSQAIAGSPAHKTFEWMEWAPPADSNLQKNLDRWFPHALPDGAVVPIVKKVMTPMGILPSNTIYAESVCSDEINHQRGGLSRIMERYWGSGVFPLGGISGGPFSGRTGFGAFSGHVPKDGNVFILFAPHVGMTSTGKVGFYLRQGQWRPSSTCASVIKGYNLLKRGRRVAADDLDDIMEAWICTKLAPLIPEIRWTRQPMVTLVHKFYEVIEDEIAEIVNTKFGTGNLVMLGGIMINMPDPYQNHFQPLHFSVSSQGMEAPLDLMGAFNKSLPIEY